MSDQTAADTAHTRFLLKELKGSAQTVLSLIEQLEHIPAESDAYTALEGELYARVNQVKFDAEDLVAALDAEDE